VVSAGSIAGKIWLVCPGDSILSLTRYPFGTPLLTSSLPVLIGKQEVRLKE